MDDCWTLLLILFGCNEKRGGHYNLNSCPAAMSYCSLFLILNFKKIFPTSTYYFVISYVTMYVKNINFQTQISRLSKGYSDLQNLSRIFGRTLFQPYLET